MSGNQPVGLAQHPAPASLHLPCVACHAVSLTFVPERALYVRPQSRGAVGDKRVSARQRRNAPRAPAAQHQSERGACPARLTQRGSAQQRSRPRPPGARAPAARAAPRARSRAPGPKRARLTQMGSAQRRSRSRPPAARAPAARAAPRARRRAPGPGSPGPRRRRRRPA